MSVDMKVVAKELGITVEEAQKHAARIAKRRMYNKAYNQRPEVKARKERTREIEKMMKELGV